MRKCATVSVIEMDGHGHAKRMPYYCVNLRRTLSCLWLISDKDVVIGFVEYNGNKDKGFQGSKLAGAGSPGLP